MNIKLKELIELKYGKRQSDVEVANGSIPIYGTGGIFGRANTALYSKPSILIGRKGTINKPFWVSEPFGVLIQCSILLLTTQKSYQSIYFIIYQA